VVKRQTLFILAALLAIAPLFHNCGAQMTAQSASKFSASSCEADMLPVFKATYYKFFSDNNCKQCHSSAGIPSIPHFAEPDAQTGLSFFMKLGPDMIENKLRAGHQTFSFTNLQPALNANKKIWNDAYTENSCSNRDVMTVGKTIAFFEPAPDAPDINVVKAAMADWQTLTWNLDNGVNKDFAGVSISIDVKVAAQQIGPSLKPINYLVDNLKITTTKHGVHLKGVYVLLNNQTYSVTTYKAVEATLAASPDVQEIAPDSAGATFMKADTDGQYQNADQWSVQIETFESQ